MVFGFLNFDTSNKSQALNDILQVGTSAGGTRAKAIIAWNSRINEVRSGQVKALEGFEYWLVKFDGVSGKRDDFSRDDLKACAQSASMKRAIADAILSQVKDVDSHIKGYSEIADNSSYRSNSFLVPTSSVWFKIIVSMCTVLRHLKLWGRLLIAGLVIGYSTPPLSSEIQKNNNLTRETVVLQLKWKHQYQFAGYYAAKEKGFYEEVGLDVEIHEHQGRPPIKALLAGEAQYAVSGANALIHRAQGYPVVALAAIYQHSPYALLVRADSGIYKVSDLTGRRVMLGSGTQDAALHAMLKRGGLSKEDYIVEPEIFIIH
ncbi:MAG: ABC transporter substrate-binding protein [Candidatus Thiodiazotropha sp. LLP2]